MMAKSEGDFYFVDDNIGDTISCLRWAPNSNFLAASSWDGKVYIWDIKQGYYNSLTAQPLLSTDFLEPVLQISWHQDGNAIFAGCVDGSVKYWDLPQNKVMNMGQMPQAAAQVHWCEVTKLLYVMSWDKTITMWDCKQPSPVIKQNLNSKVRRGLNIASLYVDMLSFDGRGIGCQKDRSICPQQLIAVVLSFHSCTPPSTRRKQTRSSNTTPPALQPTRTGGCWVLLRDAARSGTCVFASLSPRCEQLPLTTPSSATGTLRTFTLCIVCLSTRCMEPSLLPAVMDSSARGIKTRDQN
eukprot:TRINITY_DN7370_c0_g1_i35.p1 TRINITY_DN7370_c0_g1~~TRINITY_DN7370_c0_g1_i35.p1  ORF type:complete len:297 (-),score=-21.45 TRINITY_DN7370_c0_g1_i35:209-1099(-)